MDTTWKTARWSWDSGSQGPARSPLLRYHAGRPAYAVQISRQKGGATPLFSKDVHSCPIKDERDWNAWLDNVPQPDSTTVETSLSLVICPRHPDTEHNGERIRNPAILRHLPFPNEATFRRLVETFHIHQATSTMINRGWPIILRSEDHSGPEKKICYTLRCSNALENDTALALTFIPSKRLTYAIFFGYHGEEEKKRNRVDTILGRLVFAEHAALEPFTLINTFIQLEKVQRFEQVERHADEMADLIKNFQLNAATAAAKMSRPVHEDDPRDLVGLAAEMTLLRNGLVSWARELERFKAKAVVDFGSSAGGGKLPLLDAGEYLEREVDEYQMMVRRCEGMLEQVSMTFQMETSSIARQEVNKMKALAVLTMVFLPATFVATFMSMGLFNWQPGEGETVMSRYWWVYFAVAGGLTLVVFLVYFFWSRLTDAWSLWREKSDREMV